MHAEVQGHAGPSFPRGIRKLPSPQALTAVCLAGELRTLIHHEAQAHILQQLIQPLQADLFLVVSKAWTEGKTTGHHVDTVRSDHLGGERTVRVVCVGRYETLRSADSTNDPRP